MVLKRLAHDHACNRYVEMLTQYEPEDLVVRRRGCIVELQSLRIAALLFADQRSELLHSTYVEQDGSLVTLLGLAVKLGYTDLSAELAQQACRCSLASIVMYRVDPFDGVGEYQEFRFDISKHAYGQNLTWSTIDAHNNVFQSDLPIGPAWCWQCSTESVEGTRVLHSYQGRIYHETTYFPVASLSKDYTWGLRRAQKNANLPCLHAALAVVAHGGLLALASTPRYVKLRLLDAAVLLGKPSVAQILASALESPRRVRPLTFWDMVSALCDPDVVDAAIRAGADFTTFLRDVVASPSDHRYKNISLFDLAILGGHKHTANILCRHKMGSFSLNSEALSWETRWTYKIESFGNGQFHEHFARVASCGERWNAARWVFECALRRAGIQYGPLLVQILGRSTSLLLVHEVLGFVAEMPRSLWQLLT